MVIRMEQRVNQWVATQIVRKVSELGFDNAALADRLQMSEATLVRRLTSKTSFTISEIAHAAEFLQCPLTDLIPLGSEDRSAPKSAAS
jgi:hypothetical protein